MATDTPPTVKVEKVIVEFGDDLLMMLPDGSVKVFGDPDEVAKFVQARNRRAAKNGIAVIVLEWRNTPEGFVPPGEEAK